MADQEQHESTREARAAEAGGRQRAVIEGHRRRRAKARSRRVQRKRGRR